MQQKTCENFPSAGLMTLSTTGAPVLPRRYIVTDHDPTTKSRSLPLRTGCVVSLGAISTLLILLISHGVLYHRFECVAMPNGFLIGRATVFTSLNGWSPDVVIRYPDGRLFSRGDTKMHFWDNESFAGELPETPDGRIDRYVYVNNVGLIRQSERPDLYKQYFDKKMKLLRFDASRSGGHVMRTYLILYGSRIFDENRKDIGHSSDITTYRRAWCPTSWIRP